MAVNHIAMCIEFNATAREEHSKSIGQWKKIFAKPTALLKEHHKNKLQIENEEATCRQLMMVQDGNEENRMVTMPRGLQEVRNNLTERAEEMSFPGISN